MIDTKLDYAYLTTKGRMTGKARRIEVWFGAKRKDSRTLYMIAANGNGSHWVQNALANPDVKIRIGKVTMQAVARLASTLEQKPARAIMRAKYGESEYFDEDWARKGVVMTFDIMR
jgi:deazaflavin-dependent oxidoreductase (nitroreductase family)